MSEDTEGETDETRPDGGVGAEKRLESASDAINARFESIRQRRRYRAMGWLALLAFVGFIAVQGLAATDLLSPDLRWGNFRSALAQYFPITFYLSSLLPTVEVPYVEWTIDGVPFFDVGLYVDFMRQLDLLYDHTYGGLIFQWPPNLGDIYAFFFTELGMLRMFGQAGDTLAMGLIGTLLGFPLALLFGVLGSERVTPFPFNFIFRGTMSFIRAVPAIIWTLIFVPLAGLGITAATIAIAFDTIGNLGRLFVDELEEIEEGPIEAMRTTGANKPQIVFFGMLSQVRSSFIAWTLYIFEINVRVAVTVGAIGAGGLGQVVESQIGLRRFGQVMATLLAIFVLIILVELFSQRLRSRLRSDEERRSWRELIFGFPRRMAESALK